MSNFRFLSKKERNTFKIKEFSQCLHKIRLAPQLEQQVAKLDDYLRLQVLLFTQKIQNTVRDWVSNTWQRHALLEDDDFQILIVDQNFLGSNVRASYSGHEKTIYIGLELAMSEKEIRQSLDNEGHHHLIRMANGADPSCVATSGYELTMPFCSAEAAIDREKVAGLRNAIDQSRHAIAHFASLHKNQHMLTAAEQAEYTHFLSALENYNIKEYSVMIPISEYEEMFRPYLLKGRKGNNKPIAYIRKQDLSFPFETYNNQYFYAVEVTKHFVLINFSWGKRGKVSIQEKVKTFLTECQMVEYSFQKEDHTYQIGRTDEAVMIAEWSSFIAEHNTVIQQVFFSAWCEYFNDFFDTHEYCGVKQSLTTISAPLEEISQQPQLPIGITPAASTAGALAATGMGIFQPTDPLEQGLQACAAITSVQVDLLALIIGLAISGVISFSLLYLLFQLATPNQQDNSSHQAAKHKLF